MGCAEEVSKVNVRALHKTINAKAETDAQAPMFPRCVEAAALPGTR
jgi:hypothetical protein